MIQNTYNITKYGIVEHSQKPIYYDINVCIVQCWVEWPGSRQFSQCGVVYRCCRLNQLWEWLGQAYMALWSCTVRSATRFVGFLPRFWPKRIHKTIDSIRVIWHCLYKCKQTNQYFKYTTIFVLSLSIAVLLIYLCFCWMLEHKILSNWIEK